VTESGQILNILLETAAHPYKPGKERQYANIEVGFV
jgi:hypothetical protein